MINYTYKYLNVSPLKRISKMIGFIMDIHFIFGSMILIVYIDVHDFLDGYPNSVLVLYVSKCCDKFNFVR